MVAELSVVLHLIVVVHRVVLSTMMRILSHMRPRLSLSSGMMMKSIVSSENFSAGKGAGTFMKRPVNSIDFSIVHILQDWQISAAIFRYSFITNLELTA